MSIEDMTTKRLDEAIAALDLQLVFHMTKGECSSKGEPTRLPNGEIEFFDSWFERTLRGPLRKFLGLHGIRGRFTSGHYVFRITDEVWSWVRRVEDARWPDKIESLRAAPQLAGRKITLPGKKK